MTRIRAFAYVEVVVGSLILAVMTVATLQVMGTLTAGQQNQIVQSRYAPLAASLLEEILATAYEDDSRGTTFGPEAGETDGTRTRFDDVDDYHNWTATPPTRRDGTLMGEFDGVTRRVTVERVTTIDGPAANNETGYKRITVWIERDGVVIEQAQGLRTDHP